MTINCILCLDLSDLIAQSAVTLCFSLKPTGTLTSSCPLQFHIFKFLGTRKMAVSSILIILLRSTFFNRFPISFIKLSKNIWLLDGRRFKWHYFDKTLCLILKLYISVGYIKCCIKFFIIFMFFVYKHLSIFLLHPCHKAFSFC